MLVAVLLLIGLIQPHLQLAQCLLHVDWQGVEAVPWCFPADDWRGVDHFDALNVLGLDRLAVHHPLPFLV